MAATGTTAPTEATAPTSQGAAVHLQARRLEHERGRAAGHGLGRRSALRRGLGLAALAASSGTAIACAPPAPPSSVAPAELYVGLARDRVVAILDAVTDRVIERISLAPLGRQGHASQIGVAPNGAAAVLPVSGGTPDVGLVCPVDTPQEQAPSATTPASRRATLLGRLAGFRTLGKGSDAAEARCGRVQVVEQDRPPEDVPYGLHMGARLLTNDARGRAYVVVADALGSEDTDVAVLNLASGTVLRRFPLARGGERVSSVVATPDGSRLYASLLPASRWARPAAQQPPVSTDGPAPRIVVVDTKDGQLRAETPLPGNAGTVSGLALAAPPPTAASATLPSSNAPDALASGPQTLYVAIGARPTTTLDDEYTLDDERHPMLLALDGISLQALDVWSLDRSPAGIAVLPDARRAYLLLSTSVDGPWSRELLSLDLATGTTRRWPMSSGSLALTLSPVGKLYLADTLGDRLWRLDTRTDTLLPPLYLPGAPLALGARPA